MSISYRITWAVVIKTERPTVFRHQFDPENMSVGSFMARYDELMREHKIDTALDIHYFRPRLMLVHTDDQGIEFGVLCVSREKMKAELELSGVLHSAD